MRTYIIAEAGVNHNGDIEIAKKLVDVASMAGADAVKFQTFKAEEASGEYANKADYQKTTIEEESQLDMIRRLELPFSCFNELSDYAKSKGIDFISTPDGTESLKCLMGIDIPFIKIGSTEVTNLPFLIELGNTGKPLVLSTGMSTLGEVETAVKTIYSTGNKNLVLMHCTTSYPTRIEDVNLKAMVTLRDAFKVDVGLSDHTVSCEAAIAAVAFGAKYIEKHITLDHGMEGPDHKASMEPAEFAEYVRAIRNTEVLLGDGIKRPTEAELRIMKDVRRSILAKDDIASGTVISKDMLCYKRPGTGIKPEYADCLIGLRVNRDIKKEEVIKWEDLQE